MGLLGITTTLLRNLGTFYFGTWDDSYDWTSPQNDDLWQDDFKTFFDPCPTGWRVPKSGEGELCPWRNFSADGQNGETANATPDSYPTSANGGYSYFRYGTSGATAWHSAVGFRYNQALVFATGLDGRYWSTSVINTNAYFLGFNSSSVHPRDQGSRTYGHSVRCVRE